MAEAQRLITTCPTDNPFLKAFTVNDLKRKKHLVDETLDMLVEYFKSKSLHGKRLPERDSLPTDKHITGSAKICCHKYRYINLIQNDMKEDFLSPLCRNMELKIK